jgi:hypothetical protein
MRVTNPQRMLLLAEVPTTSSSDFVILEGVSSLTRAALGRGIDVLACVDEYVGAILMLCAAEFHSPAPVEPSEAAESEERHKAGVFFTSFWRPRPEGYAALLGAGEDARGVGVFGSLEPPSVPDDWESRLRSELEASAPTVVVAIGGTESLTRALRIVDRWSENRRVRKYVIRHAEGTASQFGWEALENEDLPGQSELTVNGLPLIDPEAREPDREVVDLANEIQAAVGIRLGSERILEQ